MVFGLLFTEDFLEVVEFFRDTAAALFLTKSANENQHEMSHLTRCFDHPRDILSSKDGRNFSQVKHI